MSPELSEIIDKLKDPDAASSLFPLLLVLAILGTATVVFLSRLTIRLIKLASLSLTRPKRAPEEGELVYLNDSGRFRRFLRLGFLQDGSRANPDSEEINRLRERISRLEEVNTYEREAHAKSLKKIEELQALAATLEAQKDSERRLLEAESQRRNKLQDRVGQLETQLQEAITELEKIYHQNAQVVVNASSGARASSPTSPSGNSPEQAEIDKLKQVLNLTKQHMLEMAKEKLAPPKTPPDSDEGK